MTTRGGAVRCGAVRLSARGVRDTAWRSVHPSRASLMATMHAAVLHMVPPSGHGPS